MKQIQVILEPTVNATIVAPVAYLGRVLSLCSSRHGELIEHSSTGKERFLLRYILPLSELATDFHSKLKSVTQGYATFDYEEGSEFRAADLQRLDILAHGDVLRIDESYVFIKYWTLKPSIYHLRKTCGCSCETCPQKRHRHSGS